MISSSKKLLWICFVTTIILLSLSTFGESRQKERTVSKRAPLSVHHSFEGPFVVPNWLLQGSAYFRENYVRLTPDRQSRTGALWNAAPVRLQSWEATIEFRIHGQGRTGADGLAFWYIKETNTGSLFGADASFVGLGVVLDTYDNDRSGVHPRLMVLVSDGSQEYAHNHDHDHSDGAGMERGGCFFPARNTGTKSAMRVTYTPERKLVVETDVENSGQWRHCTTVENLELPSGYFFGFTAATGELADNHDIHSLIVKNLNSETSEIYSAEQFTLASLQNRFERKLDDIQRVLPALASVAAPAGSSGPVQLSPQVLSTFDNLKRTLLSLQTEIKNEAVNLHRKLDSISIEKATKPVATAETVVVVDESSSWFSWAIILLLVLILSVLIHFQYQTRRELNKKLF